jgi:hypothetical protein
MIADCSPGGAGVKFMFVRCLPVVVACVQLSGCGCTDMGCNGALVIQPGAGAQRVEVSDGDQETHTCSRNEDCWGASDDGAATATFHTFAPKLVGVRIFDVAGRLIAEASHQPDYEVVTPNGEDCPPACKSAVVRVD